MFKKIIISLLALVLMFSAVACTSGGSKETGGGGEEEGVLIPEWNGGDVQTVGRDYSVEGTIHQLNKTETSDWLVKDGASDYVIVQDESASSFITAAVKDLQAFFAEATGIALPVITTSTAVWSIDAKYIVLGANAITTAAGVTVDYSQIGAFGYRIKTVGKSIFLLGGSDEGSAWAAYGFLMEAFNYDYFGVDTFQIDSVTNYKLYSYDILEKPDIGIRATNYQFLMNDKITRERMRLTNFGNMVITVNGQGVHNSLSWLPKSTHQAAHPKWYSADNKNLCYQARGDDAELDLMLEASFEVLKERLIAEPDKRVITYTHEDTQTLCTCDACNELRDHYNGSEAGAVVIFMNRLAQMAREWFKTPAGEQYERDLTILFFAYHATGKPPARFDEATQDWVPIDQDVVMDPWVVCYFAETNADYTRSFYDENSVNKQVAENMRGWASLSSKLYFWMYQTNFTHYLTPYNSFNNTQDTYKFAVECKADFIYDQGQSNQTGSATGWSWLKIYLYSKLTWNVNQNMDELIERFFQGFYGDGAEDMLKLFRSWQTFATYQTDVLGYTGSRSIFFDPMRTDFWPKQMLLGWRDQIQSAIDKITPLKYVDPAQYKLLMKNITVERVFVNYLFIKLYTSSTTATDLAIAKQQFYDDVQMSPILRESERGGTVAQLLTSWGIT